MSKSEKIGILICVFLICFLTSLNSFKWVNRQKEIKNKADYLTKSLKEINEKLDEINRVLAKNESVRFVESYENDPDCVGTYSLKGVHSLTGEKAKLGCVNCDWQGNNMAEFKLHICDKNESLEVIDWITLTKLE